jgi:hypothetical protein
VDIDIAIKNQYALLWAREDVESKDTNEILELAARYQEFLASAVQADLPTQQIEP